MNTLEIRQLNKTYNERNVLKDLDLDLRQSEVISIVGPSGGGKSTLLKCIAGLERPSSGKISIRGRSGMVFQQFNLFQNLTVLENIMLPLRLIVKLSKEQARSEALKLLKQLGLAMIVDQYPVQISGGQAQRAAIARTLALNPELILFDEPTSSLDPFLKKEVLELIQSIAKLKRNAILLVTHELQFAEQISDRVLELKAGNLIKV
jgi:ABC-type polar amino acid transport system ATPase subunit